MATPGWDMPAQVQAAAAQPPTHYSVLELPPDADYTSIRQAYRRLVLVCHPDKSNAQNAAELFKWIQNAYEILRDPVKKAEYDVALSSRAANPSSGVPLGSVPSHPMHRRNTAHYLHALVTHPKV